MARKRKETRPGYVRITLDLTRPIYGRLRRHVDAQRERLGISEQATCRGIIDDWLTAHGYPPEGEQR